MRASYLRPLMLVSVLLLSGCTQLTLKSNSHTAVPVNTPHTPLPADVSEALSQRSAYAVIQSDTTHWGTNIELDVTPVYYSASGRVCREMSVSQIGGALRDQVIACQYGNNWGVTRNVTKTLGQNQSL